MTSRASVSENELPVAEELLAHRQCVRPIRSRLAQWPGAGARNLSRRRVSPVAPAVASRVACDRAGVPSPGAVSGREPEAYHAGIADHADVINEVFSAFRWDGATIPSVPASGRLGSGSGRLAETLSASGEWATQGGSQPRGEHGDAFGWLRGVR